MELILGIILIFYVEKTIGKICEYSSSDSVFSSELQLPCPREGDPATYTECCYATSATEDMSQNEWMLKVVSLSVIVFCLLVMIVILVSCFWRKGICYDCCLSHYYVPDVAFYTLASQQDGDRCRGRPSGVTVQIPVEHLKMRPIEEV